jgi:hypothetical protein
LKQRLYLSNHYCCPTFKSNDSDAEQQFMMR